MAEQEQLLISNRQSLQHRLNQPHPLGPQHLSLRPSVYRGLLVRGPVIRRQQAELTTGPPMAVAEKVVRYRDEPTPWIVRQFPSEIQLHETLLCKVISKHAVASHPSEVSVQAREPIPE